MERKIFGVGEVVFDIIFKDDKPIDACPGGSVLNSLVSVNRLGLETFLISDCVADKVGNAICKYLVNNGVRTDYLCMHNMGRSRLALAFLNETNDAEYVFYKQNSSEAPALHYPEPERDYLVLFGSFFGIKQEIRQGLVDFLKKVNNKGGFILYDPNFRKSHLPGLKNSLTLIFENFILANVVKGSAEDFYYIYGSHDSEDIYHRFSTSGGKCLIITNASSPVKLFTKELRLEVPVPESEVISTVGAGDSFSAGLLFCFIRFGVTSETFTTLSAGTWEAILRFCILCSLAVCANRENYIPVGFKFTDPVL